MKSMRPSIPPALSGAGGRLRSLAARVASKARVQAKRKLEPAVRRGFDLALSGGALLVAAPVIASAAAAIKLTSPGPIFFKQVRVGKDGTPITIYKLRSMYIDAEKRLAELQDKNESVGGVTFKIKRDPRITPVGRLIRKFSIDELPQLWNVFAGNMTTFGPRPPLPREVAKYGPHERRRLEVTPGLTCLWQVSGRSDLSFEQQVALDIEYIDKATLKDDVEILAKTVPAVVTGKGAY